MKGMAMATMVEKRAVTGGVDTHLDVNVAAALDQIGGLLGVESFPTTRAGCQSLLSWLAGFGRVERVGIEGTGSYGAGLARHLEAAGVRVVEVNRSDRSARRRQGKSDPIDAVSAARAAQSGSATGGSKGRDGEVEAIRTLMVTKRSARRDRTATINQMRALISTAPDDIRARFAHHTTLRLVTEAAALRPRPGDLIDFTTRVALRELGRRAVYLAEEIDRIDALLTPLIAARAPALLALGGVGPDSAAILLVAAGDHPGRLRSEAAWAHLCGVAPIPANSGKTTGRFRLNPAGDRQANHALWRIVLSRMSSEPRTRAYVQRRLGEGKTKMEIMRCLKRYVAREVYPLLAVTVAD
jgi:transposase